MLVFLSSTAPCSASTNTRMTVVVFIISAIIIAAKMKLILTIVFEKSTDLSIEKGE